MTGATRDTGRRPGGGLHVVAGPDRHGVVIHGRRLADALEALGRVTVRLPASQAGVTPDGLTTALPTGATILLHVTDRLLGASPEAASLVVRLLATRHRVLLSLHDIPDPVEGGAWFERRRSAYAAMVAVARTVVVASHTERDRLLDQLHEGAVRTAQHRLVVIPLPLERLAAGSTRAAGHTMDEPHAQSELAVLGFLHPGKGVEDVIGAAARLRAEGLRVQVTSYGPVSEGHAELAAALHTRAAQHGVPFRVTGFVEEPRLRRVLTRAHVPVAPHRHVSASGSVNTWIAAGRRPIVRRSGYTAELATRLPGSVTLTDDLTDAARAALRDARSTWAEPGLVLAPSWRQAAQAHLDLLEWAS